MPEVITSAHNPRFKRALRLHSSRGRKQQQRTIVFGTRELLRAVEAGHEVDELFLAESNSATAVSELGDRLAGWSVVQLSDALSERLAYGDRQDGVIGVIRRPETTLPESADPDDVVVVLQAIEKPGNLGAVVRSMDACGFKTLLLADPLCDPYHPNAIRSSTGALFGMSIGTASSTEIQNWLTRRNYQVWTAYLENSQDFYSLPTSGRTAIVLGNEAQGLDDQWRQYGYQAVRLPMHGLADSLNVSVTAAVMLFEMRRQLNP